MHPSKRPVSVGVTTDQEVLTGSDSDRNFLHTQRLRRGSWFLGAAMLLVSCVYTPAATAEEPTAEDGSLSAEPYVVYVAEEEAFTRCGPSEDFYRTDPLRRGQALEVYVETADGWLGIRPPDDSFCWIPASAVELSGNSDQATVIEDKSVAWIGTHLGRARRYRWQVQLAEGESVTIVGKSERDGPDGPQLWYRIVPPSGEFRWIHQDQVVESPEQLVAQITSSDPDRGDSEFLPSGPRATTANSGARDGGDRLANRGLDAARLDVIDLEDRAPQTVDDRRRDAGEVAEAGSSRRPGRRTPPSGAFGKPDPEPAAPTTSASAALAQSSGREQSPAGEQPIGSGLREEWQGNTSRESNPTQQAAAAPRLPEPEPNEVADAASVAFVGSPRLQTIGNSYQAIAPRGTELASDSNWVGSGIPRAPIAPLGSASQATIQQVSGIADATAPARRGPSYVDAGAIARVEAESREADAAKLQLLLSRVMAAGGSAAETEPIAKAAEELAKFAEEVEARRAKTVFDRARQYQRVAQRRDGDRPIQNLSPLMIPSIPAALPAGATSPSGMSPAAPGMGPEIAAPAPGIGDTMSETGYLVQVYSARSNSPPFALTDFSGRTIAYVTPAPGVSIRMHLNNHIRVEGKRGYVSGLDTPHVLASQAIRVPE